MNCQEKAEPLYRKCIEVNPVHSFALYNLAILVEEVRGSQHGGRKEADSLFLRAMNANPNDSVTVADYGRFKLVCEKNLKEAESLLRKAISLDDTCVVANYNLGQLLTMTGSDKTVEAETCFRTVLSVDPHHVEALRYLGKLYLAKDRSQAEDFFRKAIKSLEGKLSSNNSSSTVNEIMQEMKGR